METQLQSLSKIFTERIFRIPDYQRGYAWNDKQVFDFWNDLTQLPVDKNHYVGVLTLENVPFEKYKSWEDDFWIIESKSYSPYYIVDGQQRLTTTIILIQSIVESINDDTRMNYTTKGEIRKKFLFDSKDNGISKSYLFGYEKDNPSHEYLKIRILNEISELNYTLHETTYTYNLDRAKQFFVDKIRELDISELEKIYKKLTQNFMFNIYTISSDIDVYIAFETMNNRGKALSYLELLKNRLIYLSTQFEDQYEKEKLRKNINECWMDIYKYLGMNKLELLDDDEFLSSHFMVYFGNDIKGVRQVNGTHGNFYVINRKRKISYQKYLLEHKFIGKNINDKGEVDIYYINKYVQSLKQSVQYWHEIHNPINSQLPNSVKEYLIKIKKLPSEYGDFKSLLMVYLLIEKSSKEILGFVQMIERLLFLSIFYRGVLYGGFAVRFSVDDLTRKFYEKEITGNELKKKINDFINQLLSDKDLNSRVKERFKKEGFYSWVGIRYFLFEYEQYLKSKTKSDLEKIYWDDYVSPIFDSIEHIYPQNPKNDYWAERFNKFSAKEKSLLKHSLGNLVPLSKPKNSSLKNKSFPQKVGNEHSMVGFKYGSYSEIELTNYNDWSSDQILDRGVKLLTFLEKRWGYKIGTGSRAEKVDFLGLSFLEE